MKKKYIVTPDSMRAEQQTKYNARFVSLISRIRYGADSIAKLTTEKISNELEVFKGIIDKAFDGTNYFPTDLISSLQGCIDDPHLRHFFAQPGYMQVKKPPERELTKGDFNNKLLDEDIALTELKSDIGSLINKKERLNKKIDCCQIILEELRALINKE